MRKSLVCLLCAAFAATALAQTDGGPWAEWKGNHRKTASIEAPGPAVEHAWTLDLQPDPVTPLGVIPSPGGIAVAANGDLYFKSYDDEGCFVYRVNPNDGSIIAQSVNLGGTGGNYAGVAIGVDRVFTCIYEGAPNTHIVVLDKTTLAVLDTFSDAAFSGLRGTPLISDLRDNCGSQLCGDANCDGVFNGADIDAFFLALGDPAQWAITYPNCDIVCVCDINYDGFVNGADIDPFFEALGVGQCPTAGNLYVADRNGIQIHAVDAVTGEVKWSQDVPADVPFGQLGPMWVTGAGQPPAGRQAIAYFGNISAGGGIAIADNGDGTCEVLWNLAGPDSFNWWGSGVLSADGERIYVTTFNDGGAHSLWAISVADGSVVWSYPGEDPFGEPLNFFARPAVVGNRIYCGGADGAIACYEDQGTSVDLVWTYRDYDDEHTSISAAYDASGNTHVYAVKQGLSFMYATLIVLRDDGANYTTVLQTSLGSTMLPSIYSINSCTLDAEGSLYIGGGEPRDPGIQSGAIYKFEVAGP